MQAYEKKQQVYEEVRQISKYAGLLAGRIGLLACLLFLFYAFRPTSIYLFAFGVAFPPVFTSLNRKQEKNPETPLLLASLAQKFFYSPARFRGELYTGYIFTLGLFIWQLRLRSSGSRAFPLSVAPGLILLFYLLCRIICTRICRHKIKTYYKDLKIFDE